MRIIVSGPRNREKQDSEDKDPYLTASAEPTTTEPEVTGRKPPRNHGAMAALPATASAVALIVYGALSIIMWRIYYSPSWDLGIFTQLLNDYAHGHAPIVDIKGPGYNLWGDHFHPILLLLTPIFKLWPSGLTLMLIQTVLFAASVWPIVSLAVERLSRSGAWALAFSYVFSWGMLNAVWSQFHEIAFAVPLLAFGMVWWLRGHKWAGAIAIGLLVFVKEDMGVTVAMFGIALWLRNRADVKWQIGLFAWGVVASALQVLVIIPAFNTGGEYDYSQNIVLHELFTAGTTDKLALLGILVLAAGVVGVRSPFILMMLPTLGWRFIGNVEAYWGTGFHYSAVLIPIAAVCLIDGVGALERRAVAARSGAATGAEPTAGEAVSGPGRLRTWAPLTAAVAAVAMVGQTQVNLFWESDKYKVDAAPAIAEASKYRSVATDVQLLAYLVPKTHTYWYGQLGTVKPDAVLLKPGEVDQSVASWAQSTLGGDWKTVYDGNGFQVVVRDGAQTR